MVKTNDSQQKFTLPEIIVEGMRNDTVFRYGASLEGLGIEDAQIERRLREANAQRCIPPMEDSEVSRIVRSVLSLRSGRPMSTGVNRGATHERIDANLSQTEQAARQIEACFAANDIVTLITKFGRNPEGKPIPNGKPVSIPACTLINKLRNADSLDEVFPDYDREAGILFYINPMKINGRKNEDVTAFRTALIEYDDISKKEQVERLLDSGLPILSITDSGNKSVHALVRVDADNVSSYTKKVGKLHKALEKKYGSPCDVATKNPARLSRLAGAQRKDGVQQLLYTEVNLDANLDDRIDALNTVTRDLGTPSCNGVAEQLIRMHDACMVEGVPAIRKGGEYMFGQDAIFREVIGIYPDARSGFRKEVMSYIDLMAPKKPQADPKYIRFKNGVLDIETLELTSNNGTHLLLNEVPHDWNPEAESELVDKTFGSIAQGNEAVIANLWEMFGLSLYRGHDVSRMILLQGSGANGKSTLLDMLKCLLGVENCFSLPIHELGEKFQLVPAMGKLALIGDDIASDFVNGKACAVMKKFVTGEAVNDQYKGGATFQFNPYATLIYSCNEIPRFADGTFGFERRIHPIPLTARFAPGSDGYDPRLKQKLCAEECIEYAIVKAVDALRAARERMGLTPNSLSERMRADILRDNDPAGGFITEMTKQGYVFLNKSNSMVYGEFEDWCAANGYEPVSKSKLSAKIRTNLGLQSRSSNGVRVYLPIKERTPRNA